MLSPRVPVNLFALGKRWEILWTVLFITISDSMMECESWLLQTGFRVFILTKASLAKLFQARHRVFPTFLVNYEIICNSSYTTTSLRCLGIAKFFEYEIVTEITKTSVRSLQDSLLRIIFVVICLLKV